VFTTIACAADGSPPARSALTVAAELTRNIGGTLVIIFVQEITISRSGLLTEDNTGTLAELTSAAERLRQEGIDATVQWSRATGDETPNRILELAGRAGADLLVVGHRGHGSLANLLLGSVATRLLQLAPSPVLLVPASRTAATDANLGA
jgi:nucleotide-binding universal stress UspA family protein